MNVNEGKHQAKLLEWKDRAAAGGSGGMDVKRGRAENGCSPKTYDRWEQEILGKVRQIAKTQFLVGVAGLSQILCKHRNAVQIEQNLFKAEVAQAAAALFSK